MPETLTHPLEESSQAEISVSDDSLTSSKLRQIEEDTLIHDFLELMTPVQKEFLEKMEERIKNGDQDATFIMDLLQKQTILELKLLKEASEKNALQEAKDKSDKEARTDTLTELPNRKAFEEWEESVESINDRPVYVVMCDVNRLKQVNDQISHHAGDELIAYFGKILEENTRGIDSLPARLGGDEFVFGVVGATADRVKEISHSLARAMNNLGVRMQTQEVDGQQVSLATELVLMEDGADLNGVEPLKVSIGIAKKHPGESMKDLRDRADNEMYKAKTKSKEPDAKPGDEVSYSELE